MNEKKKGEAKENMEKINEITEKLIPIFGNENEKGKNEIKNKREESEKDIYER